MTNIRFRILLLLAFAYLAASCAVDPETDSYYSYDRVMKAWMKLNYPGIQPYGESGAYILDMERGNGPAVTDSVYVFAHYIKRTLDRAVTETNVREISVQLGQYTPTTYYGSDIWRIDRGYLPAGLEEVIKTMNAGGHTTIALPYSASTHTRSLYSAFSGSSESGNILFEMTIDTVVANIYDYQENTMKQWFREHYGVSDTASMHLYFKKIEEKTEETDTISEGTSVNVRYIGRLMNGQVFDTNIQDTAKFYRIYSTDNSYDALSVTFYKSDGEKLSEDNSVVAGFAKAVSMMNYGETAVTLFNSELGYGESGSSPSIPEYSPIVFWLYIEPK